MAICFSVAWGTNILISFLFLQLIEWMTGSGVFFMFSGISILGFGFVWLLVPETMNKSVSQIHEELKGN